MATLGVAAFLTLSLPSAALVAATQPTALVVAMAYVGSRTHVPLEAPRSLPPEQWRTTATGPWLTAPDTAQVSATARSYSVSLFNCPHPLPLNDRGFEQACGFIEAIYGGFGGTTYPSSASALLALASKAQTDRHRPSGCKQTRRVLLRGGVQAEVYEYGPSGGNCLAYWDEGGWEFVFSGDLNGNTGWGAWPATADQLLSYLSRHQLPAVHGELDCEIAGDGLPTNLIWADGHETYTAGMYHSAFGAIDMADAMAAYR